MLKNLSYLRAFYLSVIFTATLFTANAQQKVNGKIMGPNNLPVKGASVTVKNTTISTLTSDEGFFTIDLPAGKTVLVFSYIGYQTLEMDVRGKPMVDIKMNNQMNDMNEVIVTGYSSQRKKDLTGAVSVIKVGDLLKVAAPSFAQQMEGRATGVQVTTSGAPGSGASIRIRGNSTFSSGGGDPLIVLDGVQMKGAYFNDINSNDIESIQVLKDAATTASYGIGANAGVIIITTKKGRTGQPKVEYSGFYGTQTPVKGYDQYMIKTSGEYADLVFQSYNNSATPISTLPNNSFTTRVYGNGSTPVLPDYVNPLPDSAGAAVNPGDYSFPDNLIMRANQQGTDWWNAVMQTAPITEHNINASGASEKARYFFSFNYFKQEGTMRYTDFERFTVRANTEYKVKSFTFGENITAGFSNSVGQPSGNQSEQNVLVSGILKMQPIIPVYDEGGNWGGTRTGFGNGRNGVAELYRNKDNRGQYFRLVGNVFGELRFLKNFSARVNFGLNYGNNFNQGFTYIDPEANEPRTANGFNENTQRYLSWVLTEQLNYTNNFGKHSVNVIALHEAQLYNFRQIGGSLNNYFLDNPSLWYLQSGLADPSTRTVSSFGNKGPAKESLMGKLEYIFNSKYLLNATARYDQSSVFPVEKGQVFGGVGLGWIISEEDFMSGVHFFNTLKLRGAWGVTGNDAVDPSRAYSSFGGGAGTTFYDMNGSNTSTVTGYTATALGNPNMRWEKQEQVNIGLDAYVMKNRLEISLDVYQRKNKDFLFARQYPGTFPYDVSSPFENIGSISNKGLELSATWRDKIGNDFTYSAGLNFTHNVNKIEDLAQELGLVNFFANGVESRIGPLIRHEIGQPMSTFYGYTLDGIFQTEAEATASGQSGAKVGRFKWKDVNGDRIIDDNDKGAIGDPNPKFIFGLNLTAAFKGFDFSMFLQGTQGNQIYNYTRYFTDFFGFSGNRSERMLYESWTPTRTNAKLPLLDIDDTYSSNSSSYYVEDGSYLRCRVLQIGYRLPASMLQKAKIDNLRIYIQGQNLFTITNYGGLDPALGTRSNGNAPDPYFGIDSGNYPSSRTISFGVNLGF